MKKLLFLLTIIITFSMAHEESNPLFISSNSLPKYNQNDFQSYIADTKKWLEDNRVFLSENRVLELELNTPFEEKPKQKTTKGILLVHGLGDSPGYFKDLSKQLVKKGFLVRTVLLTGHGSKPADLLNVDFENWKDLVHHHIKLLEKDVDELWLGGFSTGTNLVTSYAIENQDRVSGLLLFSPGFASDEEGLLPWAGIGSFFKSWLFQNEKSNNILRYESLSMNAAHLYYRTLEEVQKKLEEKEFVKPVFITISEDDSVIEAERIIKYFSKNFTNPKSRLLWFGKKPSSNDRRVVSLKSYLPNRNIGNFSHLSVLFDKNNSFYGKDSSYKMYRNGQEKEYNPNVDELWYSAWGLQEEGKYFARLTWNPYFNKTMTLMSEVLNSN